MRFQNKKSTKNQANFFTKSEALLLIFANVKLQSLL